jgi:hypothetical protein
MSDVRLHLYVESLLADGAHGMPAAPQVAELARRVVAAMGVHVGQTEPVEHVVDLVEHRRRVEALVARIDDRGYVFALAHEDDVKILRWKEKWDAIPEKTFHGKIKGMSGTATANPFGGDPAKKFDVLFSVDMKELMTGLGAKPDQIQKVLETAARAAIRFCIASKDLT